MKARLTLLLAMMALMACEATGRSPRSRDAPDAPARFVPKAVRIEPSGFASVQSAPSRSYPDAPPAPDDRPVGDEAAWYARQEGISEAEARKRLAEQETITPELERLLAALRTSESGNFTAPRLVHSPDWAYVFYFKRDPAATLARHSKHPRFRAALARYTRAELDALIAPWVHRFEQARILGGYGSDETFGTADFMLTVTHSEYLRMAASAGWSPPDAILLSFADELRAPASDPRAAPLVRIFPQADRSTAFVDMSATLGRIVLRDGCFRVERADGATGLAYFAREAGLTIDEDGYLALRARTRADAPAGRIGEMFVWAGYGTVTEAMAMVPELRERCGQGPIMHVGSPTSLHDFRVRPFAIDEYARRRSLTRQAAWDEIKACWRRQDSHPQMAAALPMNCDR